MAKAKRDVFVNCPFDLDYKDLLNAIAFTVIRSGFRARSALEVNNAAENRFEKICQIINECRFGIHDISRTETGGDPPLPRFNMPLELGLFLGARKFGGQAHRAKACIIFDRERHRYQRFISDIAGQDISAHDGEAETLIVQLAAWLREHGRNPNIPGGRAIAREYRVFMAALPGICGDRDLHPDEVTFGDYIEIVAQYLGSARPG